MVTKELEQLSDTTLTWIVQIAILQYLEGADAALIQLGDKDRSQFRSFASGYFRITQPRDFKHHLPESNKPDYRGLVCCVMDDLGIRNQQQRSMVLYFFTKQE